MAIHPTTTARGKVERSNEQWLAALRSAQPPHDALEDLSWFLRRGLGKALTRSHPLNESDLDDFTQEAVLRVLERLDTFRGDSRFTTWAMAVSIRVALSELRRRHHREVSLQQLDDDFNTPLESAAPDSADPQGALDREHLLESLRRAIQTHLTPRQRAVILGELAGVPPQKLVQQLDTNPNALYKLHHDARRKLRQALREAGFSDEDVRTSVQTASTFS